MTQTHKSDDNNTVEIETSENIPFRKHLTWKKEFKKTKDIIYAVLAIGRVQSILYTSEDKCLQSEHLPELPRWALNACSDYFEDFDKNHFDPMKKSKKGSTGIPSDDEKLDEMAVLILGGATKNKAASIVTGEKFGSSIRRLTKKWDKEFLDINSDDKMDHPRIIRKHRLKNSFLFKFQS